MKHKPGYRYARMNTIHEYELLPISMDIGVTSVREVVMRLGPATQYDIHAGWRAYETARVLQQDVMSKQLDNPFAPIVNVSYELALKEDEWYIVANDYAVGCSGF